MAVFIVLWPYLLTTKLRSVICHNLGHSKVHVWNGWLHKKTYIPKNMNLHMYYITQLNHNGSGRNKMTCNFANMTILLSGTIFFFAKFISYLLNCRCSTAFTQFVHAHSSVYFFDILHTFE